MRLYKVCFNEKTVGQAEVAIKGLYYLITCKCRLVDDSIYRLQVDCGEKTTDLGVLTKENGCYTRKTSIAIKHIGYSDFEFRIVNADVKLVFVPLDENKPLARIKDLESARFGSEGKKLGLYIKESDSLLSDPA